MKILLLGANGQIGHELRRSLASLGELVAATRSGALSDGGACEVADFDRPGELAGLVGRIGPDVVVNAAAYTAVDKAEGDAQAAFRVNAEAPGVLALACAARGIRFVHYSTDYVFDGKASRPYREDDAAAPLGVYGASKLAGEQAVFAAGGTPLVLRTAWVYALRGHNFLRTMLRLGAEHEELRVVVDQVGAPTPAWLIADATRDLVRLRDLEGMFHVSAGGRTSWHGFAEAIFDEAKIRGLIERRPRVLPVVSAHYPTRAVRPACSCLDSSKLERRLARRLPDWRACLISVLGN